MLLFAVAAAVVFAFIKLTREEMELAPLRRRLQAAYAKVEDVNKVVREWRMEQRKRAKREEEERQVVLLKRKSITSVDALSEDKSASSDHLPHSKQAKGSSPQEELDLDLDQPLSSYNGELAAMRETVL